MCWSWLTPELMLKAWNQHGEIIYNREIGKYYKSEFGVFFLWDTWLLNIYQHAMLWSYIRSLCFLFTSPSRNNFLKNQSSKVQIVCTQLMSIQCYTTRFIKSFIKIFHILKFHISVPILWDLYAQRQTEDSCKYGWQEMAFCTRTQKEWYILVNSLFYFTFPQSSSSPLHSTFLGMLLGGRCSWMRVTFQCLQFRNNPLWREHVVK